LATHSDVSPLGTGFAFYEPCGLKLTRDAVKALHRRILVWSETTSPSKREHDMAVLALATPILLAAAGYSLIYLLMGGGLGGAILIFIVAKMLGR
jgi:hypothetical protein